jgi:hypothetical protein
MIATTYFMPNIPSVGLNFAQIMIEKGKIMTEITSCMLILRGVCSTWDFLLALGGGYSLKTKITNLCCLPNFSS